MDVSKRYYPIPPNPNKTPKAPIIFKGEDQKKLLKDNTWNEETFNVKPPEQGCNWTWTTQHNVRMLTYRGATYRYSRTVYRVVGYMNEKEKESYKYVLDEQGFPKVLRHEF